MNLAWAGRITRRRSSRFSARLLRTCNRVLMDMDMDKDNSNLNRRKCNVSMEGHMETAV
jgi:hypothetical protein